MPPHTSSRDHGARLGRALLAYMVGVTCVITLLPFDFARPERLRIMVTGNALDVALNVLLFVPLGFLFRLGRPRGAASSRISVLVAGAFLSMVIESVQLLEPERYSSVLDVLTNSLGAWLGALAHDRLSKQSTFDARLVGRLSLELPLMGLVYLLVPLLSLSSLAHGSERLGWLLLLPGLTGAMVLGGLARHRFAPAGMARPGTVALLAVAWYFIGTIPALPRAPVAIALGALAVGSLAFASGSRRMAGPPSDRRFERVVLRGAAPGYVAYLAVLSLLPLIDGASSWHWTIALPGVGRAWDRVAVLRFLELVAALTLVGYMVAESRGREERSFRTDAPRLTAWCAGVAILLQVVQGFRVGSSASVSQLVSLVAAGAFGGWLYFLQRDFVIALLTAPRRVAAAHDVPVTHAPSALATSR